MAAYAQDVGQRIREARERNRPGISQEDLAHELGVSSKTIGRWERGEVQPRDRQWEPLAKKLKVAVADLRGRPPLTPEEELRARMDQINDRLAELKRNQEGIATAIEGLSVQIGEQLEAMSAESAARFESLLAELAKRSQRAA